MNAHSLLVVGLVVLAGCSGGLPGRGTKQRPGTRTAELTNPWANETVGVAVDAPAGQQRRYRNLTRRALRYWNDNARQYTGYHVRFRLVNHSDARIHVAFVAHVRTCDQEDHTAGCAPLIEHPALAPHPVNVRVERGFDDASTVLVVEHELGHVLGLGHDEGPANVMAATSDLDTRPRPNATERRLPWNDSTFTVAVVEDVGSTRNESRVDAQVDAALHYYEAGADGRAPESVTFRRVADPGDAEIVIEFEDAATCAPDGGSCNEFAGVDPDGDGAFERYTNQRITLVRIPTAVVGWHVAYWLGATFGLDDPRERPPVLRPDVSPLVRRNEWWS
ncbi:MAG: matrixin family metalloprotease [Haloarculaceae archaeon]